MTVPAPTVCCRCKGDQVIRVVRRARCGDLVELRVMNVPCPDCRCPVCGRDPVVPGLLCEVCDSAAELEFDTRARRAEP